MKTVELLPKDVTYYKANLHCHTVLSDGRLTPGQIKEHYQERGYQIIAFTDHNHYGDHRELCDENFIAIAALETDMNQAGDMNWNRRRTWHMNWYDTCPDQNREVKEALSRPQVAYEDMDAVNAYVEKMAQIGFIGCYNHPYWSLQTCDEYTGLKGLWAMEIYNHGCEMDGLFGYHPQAYDEMLRNGRKIFCVASDDNHNSMAADSGLYDSFGGYVMIGARSFTYDGVMEALKRGDFYSCCAPDGQEEAPRILEFTLEGKHVHISCTPAEKIFLKSEGRNCHRAAARPGETITEADFELDGEEGYIRLDISDGKGRHTVSNACFLKDLE